MQQIVSKQPNKGGSPKNDSSANPLHETERTVRDWCQTAWAEETGKVGKEKEQAKITWPKGDDYPVDGRRDKDGTRILSRQEFYREDLVKARSEIRELERWIRDHPPLHLVNRKVQVKEVACGWKRWTNIMWSCAREGCNGHTGDAVKDQYGCKVNFDYRGYFCHVCESLEHAKLRKLGEKFIEYRRKIFPGENDEWMKYGFSYCEGEDTSHIRRVLNEEYVPTVEICELQASPWKPIEPSTGEETSSGEDEKGNFTQQSRRKRRRRRREKKERKAAMVANAISEYDKAEVLTEKAALVATDSKSGKQSDDGVEYGRTSGGCVSARPIPPPPPPPLLLPKDQLETCIDPQKTKKRKRKK